MSAYTDRPRQWYQRHPYEEDTYRVAMPLTWHIGRVGSGHVVRVPSGFDFEVSVPAWLRWAADPNDYRFLAAAALHDWTLEDGWDRWTAAAVFRSALEADGVSAPRRSMMALATITWPWVRQLFKR